MQEKSVVNKDTELFMKYCKVYQDYFKRAEIEGMDMVVGHLAVITRDAVLEAQKETEEKAVQDYQTNFEQKHIAIAIEIKEKETNDKWLKKIEKIIKESLPKGDLRIKGERLWCIKCGNNYRKVALDQATNIIKELVKK